jgi:hypothetical protein
VLQIDNYSNFVHPADRRVWVVGQVLGVLLTRLGRLVKAVVGPKLVTEIGVNINVTRQSKVRSPFTVEPTLPPGDWRITNEVILPADTASLWGDFHFQ